MEDPRAVLITGATGGIGAALAEAYARPGRQLFLQGRRQARLSELSNSCEGKGARVETKALDLADTPALLAWAEGVAPRVDLARYQVDSGMREVATTLMLAQKEAVASQHEVLVAFDTTGRALEIHWDANNDHVQDSTERVRRVGLVDGVTFGRPSGVSARAFGSATVVFDAIDGRPTLVFHRNGSASESGRSMGG